LFNVFGDFYGNEVSFITNDAVYLAENGVTVKAYDWANIGDTGVINDITYTVVDEAMLREMVNNEEDVSKLATTRVTNMSNLFFGADAFNQPIGNWDVSNVTNMFAMFTSADAFNQPIGNWNVSNVTGMRFMFNYATSFSQPIGDWNTSNVTNMEYMFNAATSFNQNLSSWSVDGVIDCNFFSQGTTSWTLPQPNFTNCTP